MVQPISLGYGKITFDTASCNLAAFVIDPGFVRQFPSKRFPRRGRAQAFPVSDYPEVNGTLMLDTLEMPDGTIICLQSSQRSRGVSMRDGAVFIRIREQGPMLAINAAVPVNRYSHVGTSHLVFQGRGDLMSLDELIEAGSTPTNGWIEGFLEPDEISQCFDIREMDGEQAPRPKLERITNLSGDEVTLQSAQPSRRIRVR